ncbi:Chromatin assembly factor 1 subunit B [Papilio xuthus]|uniref:Chromatin assembly factor 1 subunit B n=1 Tax=Papilio xuthus TaxID=66420 RepID=A0A194QJ32_PAPXU|nr:Chromatin assembly factor 1 subunit B [Papilio xuthus]
MKFSIPEISWHNRDPVLSVDIQPKCEENEPLRLATGGTDTHVLIWHISITDNGSIKLEVAADLTRHQKSVNVVRWSPDGKLLASGDDESIIFIWKPKTEDSVGSTQEQSEEQYKENWVIHKTLRGHVEDVLDLSWSVDSAQLASGSVDNKLLMWDVAKGKYTCLSTDQGFVQGVSWDPKGQFIASASSDRTFRTFDIATKKVISKSSKAVLPFPKDHALYDTKVRLYHDDTLQTYYRRLEFSPDGLFVAVPAGRIEPEQGKMDFKPINAVYIYTRYSLKVPACVLPCGEPALAVRWSPVRYKPRASGPQPAFPTPGRFVLAVATKRSVLLYDTQQKTPIALISNIHYTRLTDLTWSSDGRVLVASSTDGFCSVITFTEDELGEPLPDDVAEKLESTGKETVKLTNKENKQEENTKPTKVSNIPKIDSFIKFKAPDDSPKKQKIDKIQQKTPVKVDLLVETAMSSWSDSSNNEIIRPKPSDEPMEVDSGNRDPEVMVIEDSEDMKLVYEDTLTSTKQSDKKSPETKLKNVSPKQSDTPTSSNRICESNFLKQAKVTDIKEPVAVKAVPSPKAPRRVSFVTLSSPKNKKTC